MRHRRETSESPVQGKVTDMRARETDTKRHGAGPTGFLAAAVAALTVAAGGCDVTNPGPVQDQYLDSPQARAGVVAGMIRAMSDVVSAGCGPALTRQGGSVAREVFPAGNTGTCGITVAEARGELPFDEENGIWTEAQNARWVAEDGIRRFEETMESSSFESSALVAEAHVWAGFANRMMGENFCRAVIDGGSAQPHTVYFERAEQFFSRAIQVAQSAGAPDVARAAQAGRASVRLHLGDYTGAESDANAVPKDFSFDVPYSNISQDQRNTIWWSQQSTPYRTITVWNTPNWDYYQDSGDPRVEWATDPEHEFGDAAREIIGGNVPFVLQLKYQSGDAPVDLADGREMLLIRAEVLLQDGQWENAMDLINELRTDVGVAERSASNSQEAWTYLKAERRIELWLEARRLGDLRRWSEAGTPGDLHPLEDPSNPDSYLVSDPDLCFPISETERNTNPNVG